MGEILQLVGIVCGVIFAAVFIENAMRLEPVPFTEEGSSPPVSKVEAEVPPSALDTSSSTNVSVNETERGFVSVPTDDSDSKTHQERPPEKKRQMSLADDGLIQTERSELLALHNGIRQGVGVASLTWSSKLGSSAAIWAGELASRGCALDHSGGPYGENIYYSSKFGDTSPRTPAEVMGSFMEEAAFYDHKGNSCSPGEICGHYTQIVWEDSKYIGCAKRLCLGNEREEIWVCHYDPPGNVVGKRPY